MQTIPALRQEQIHVAPERITQAVTFDLGGAGGRYIPAEWIIGLDDPTLGFKVADKDSLQRLQFIDTDIELPGIKN